MTIEQTLRRLQHAFPKWLFRVNKGRIYGFCNLKSCITYTEPETPENSFSVAVRVGEDGAYIFSKEKEPNIHFLNQGDYLSLEDLKGAKGKGIYPIQFGFCPANGRIRFSDCVFEPGIHEQDYLQLRSLLMEFSRPK